MDDATYLEVDSLSPFVGTAVAILLVLLFVPLFVDSLLRRRRFNRLNDGEQTYQRRNSIRLEKYVGLGCLAAGVILAAASLWGYSTSRSNLVANIQQLYDPVEVSVHPVTNSFTTADITLRDGTRFTDAPIEIRAGNEPFIEKVWYHYNPKP